MIAVPAQIKNERDEAEQPPNSSANQHSSIRRTTPDISVAGGNQDANQLAHALIIVNCAHAVSQGSRLGSRRRAHFQRLTTRDLPALPYPLQSPSSSPLLRSHSGCRSFRSRLR